MAHTTSRQRVADQERALELLKLNEALAKNRAKNAALDGSEPPDVTSPPVPRATLDL